MSSSCGNRIRYETLRSVSAADIIAGAGDYVGIGTQFAHPVRILKVSNATDANLLVSLDGVTAVDFVAANSFYLYDFSSNKATIGGYLEQPAGDRIYVKPESTNPTAGSNVYVTIIYAATS